MRSPKGRVWIPVQGELKYQKAKRFGELEVIFSNRVLPTRYPEILTELRNALLTFHPEMDSVLVSGNIVDSLAVGLLAAEEKGVYVLLWDVEIQDFIRMLIL